MNNELTIFTTLQNQLHYAANDQNAVMHNGIAQSNTSSVLSITAPVELCTKESGIKRTCLSTHLLLSAYHTIGFRHCLCA